jgi:asparagine synthase (glutamine-hydrolysing)
MDAVIAATHVEPHWVRPKPADALDEAERMTWFQDEPFGSTSIFAQHCVFGAARAAGIKVMLDGQGADEQLAGYHTGFPYYLADLLRRGRWLAFLRALRERQQWHGVPLSSQVRSLLAPLLPDRVRNFLFRKRQALSHHDWLNSPAFQPLQMSGDAFNDALVREALPPTRGIGDLCRAMVEVMNLPMLLRYEDRSSMTHGVEARVPFLDHRLVEFSIGLGDRHKIVGGDTKRVLRRAMDGILPEKIVNRRDKLGFATPEQEWFRGPLRSRIEAGVEDTLARYPDLLNAAGTRELVREMLDGRRPMDFKVWRIVNVGIWGRVHTVAL